MANLVTMYGEDGKSVQVFPVDVAELEESGYTKEPKAVKRAEPAAAPAVEEEKPASTGRGRPAKK